MKKTFYTFCIALALSFSAFCFIYLHAQEVPKSDTTNTQLLNADMSSEEDNELYFPDLAFIEKVSILFSKMSKVF